jgi:hypothetical protein
MFRDWLCLFVRSRAAGPQPITPAFGPPTLASRPRCRRPPPCAAPCRCWSEAWLGRVQGRSSNLLGLLCLYQRLLGPLL